MPGAHRQIVWLALRTMLVLTCKSCLPGMRFPAEAAKIKASKLLRGVLTLDTSMRFLVECSDGQIVAEKVNLNRRGKRDNAHHLHLRGGGDESDEEEAEFLYQTCQGNEMRWEGLSGIPGFEDAMPHPDVTGWDADEYTRRGIDMSGGALSAFAEDPDKAMDDLILTEMPEATLEQQELEAEEAAVCKAKIQAKMYNNPYEREESEDGSSAELEKQKEEALEGICPMCPAEKGPAVDWTTKPVKEMTYEDWDRIPNKVLVERIGAAVEAWQKKQPSPLFDAEFVYSLPDDAPPEQCGERLFKSFLGIQNSLPAAQVVLDKWRQHELHGVNKSLTEAALDGDPQACGFWIRRGADPNCVDGLTGLTPLMYAAENGQTRVVTALVELGANPFVTECVEGRTALHLAACEGWCDVVRVLAMCEGGGGVDVPSGRRGRTALHDAAANGQTHTVATLVSLGADVRAIYPGLPAFPDDEPFQDDSLPLNEKAQDGQASEKDDAGEGDVDGYGEDNEEDGNGSSVLPNRNLWPLQGDFRLRAFASQESTALHDAAEGGFRQTCLTLLAAGASLHATDGDGLTARERAAARGTSGDPFCPMYRKGGVLDALDDWEHGVIGPQDVPPPPSSGSGGPVGMRGMLNEGCGREVRGEGGDVVGWEAPWNHNGMPARGDNELSWRTRKDHLLPLAERDMLAYRNKVQQVRRKGFWNPGHVYNFGTGARFETGQVMASLLASILIPYKGKMTRRQRETRIFRKFLSGGFSEQGQEQEQEHFESGAATPGASKMGFFREAMQQECG